MITGAIFLLVLSFWWDVSNLLCPETGGLENKTERSSGTVHGTLLPASRRFWDSKAAFACWTACTLRQQAQSVGGIVALILSAARGLFYIIDGILKFRKIHVLLTLSSSATARNVSNCTELYLTSAHNSLWLAHRLYFPEETGGGECGQPLPCALPNYWRHASPYAHGVRGREERSISKRCFWENVNPGCVQSPGRFPEQNVISLSCLNARLYYSGKERIACPIPAFTLHVGNLLVVFLPVKASVANFNDLLSFDWYTAK